MKISLYLLITLVLTVSFYDIKAQTAYAGEDQAICLSTVQLQGNDPAAYGYTGQWILLSGQGTIQNPTLYNTWVTGLGNTANVFRWIWYGSPGSADEVTITNNLPNINAGFSIELCNASKQMSATAPASGETGLWTQTDGPTAVIETPTLNNTYITSLQNGTATFQWAVSNQFCTNTEEIQITRHEAVADAGDDVSSCYGTATLSAEIPPRGTGQWMPPAAGNIQNPNQNITAVTDLPDGQVTFEWKVEYNGCVNSDEVTVYNTNITSNAGNDKTICGTESVLNANNPGSGAYGVWELTYGSGNIVSPSNYYTQINGLATGENRFSWTIYKNGCEASSEVSVTNAEITEISAGTDTDVCSYTEQLAADSPPTGMTGTWIVETGTAVVVNPTLFNSEIYNMSRGENRFRWTLDNGHCTASDVVIFTNNIPTDALVSPDDEICTDSYSLSGSVPEPGETGLWTLESGSGNIQNPNLNGTDVTDLGYGPNTFRWTISNGLCDTYDEITITNGSLSTETEQDKIICESSTTISATNSEPENGFWSVVSSNGLPYFDQSLSPLTQVHALGFGANTFKWQISNGICEAYDIITITSNIPPSAFAGNDKESCTESTVLSATEPTLGNGIWTIRSGGGTILTPSFYNTTVNDLEVGENVFRWTLTYLNCSNYDEVTVTRKYITVSAGNDDETCSDFYESLQGNEPGPGQYGEWTVAGGSGNITNPASNITTVSNLQTGENDFLWTIYDGICSEEDLVTITNNIPTTASTGNDQEICENTTSISGNQPNNGTGEWTTVLGGGIIETPLNNLTAVSDIPEGLNQYQWTITKGGCSSSAVISVTNNEVSAATGSNDTICDVRAQLVGNQPGIGETGIWTVVSGSGTVENPELYNSYANNLSLGLNRFKWTINKGECSDYALYSVISELTQAQAWVSGPSEICTDNSAILGNTPNTGAEGTWTIIAGTGEIEDPHNPSTHVYSIPVGTTKLRWTIVNNECTDYAEISITNNSISAYAGTDDIVCDEHGTLSGNIPQNFTEGQWTLLSGAGSISEPLSPATSVSGLAYGANTFRWEVNSIGCSDADNVVLLRNDFTISAGLDKTICETSTFLNGQDPSPGYGVWTHTQGNPGVIIVDPTDKNTQVTGITYGSTNIFRWTVYKNNCSAYDEVTVSNVFVQAFAGADQSVCENSAMLSADEPSSGSGVWTLNSGGGYIQNPNAAQTNVTGLATGANVFTWTVTNSNCVSSDQVVVSNDMISASAGSDQLICDNYTILAAEAPPADGYGEWEIINGSLSIEDPGAFNSPATDIMTGTSTLEWTVYLGNCNSGGDQMTITNNSFEAFAGEDQVLPFGATNTTLNATLPTGGSGSWAIYAGGGNIANPNDPNTEVSGMLSGENTYNWTVQLNGCTDEDQVIVLVRDFEAFAGEDIEVCADSADMNARNENLPDQEWSLISGSGIFQDPNDPKTRVYDIARGSNIYRWTVSENNYVTYDDVEVINRSFDIYAGEDVVTCSQTIQLNGEAPGSGNSGLWTVVGGSSTAQFNNPILYNTWVYNLSPGVNLLTWQVERNNCYDSDTVEIFWNRPPIANFDIDFTEINAPGTVGFFNNSSHYPEQTEADEFYWYMNEENFDITYSPYSLSSYYFEDNLTGNVWHNASMVAHDYETGCTDTAEVDIMVHYTATTVGDINQEKISVYPNPAQEHFFIKFSQPADYVIDIYDLRGRLVHKQSISASNTSEVDIKHLPDGHYKFILHNSNTLITGALQIIN